MNAKSSDNASKDPEAAWHCLTADAVVKQLQSSASKGLTAEAARQRLQRDGANELPMAKRAGIGRLFVAQFRDFMIIVLLVAAVIASIIGDAKDAIAILVIVALNAVLGSVQQFRAERAINALRKLAAPEALVIRDGVHVRLAASELVCGDIVVLESGVVVPADVRLLEAVQLQADESSLTGESVAAEKNTEVCSDHDLAVAARCNLSYRGTRITRGRGKGVVVATGSATQIGRIGKLLVQSEREKTPLEQRLKRFGQRLAVLILLICAAIFIAGVLRGEAWMLMLLTAVSLAVAAIPEALPAVVSISLALGAHKMSAKNALIRRLPAVETLGSVTYICADKTGTLTQNRMHVEMLVGVDNVFDKLTAYDSTAETGAGDLFRAMALANDVVLDRDGEAAGDPTEIAIYTAARQAGYAKTDLGEKFPRIADIPFSSERQRMSTLHRDTDSTLVFCKGAPEAVIPRCVDLRDDRGTKRLDAGRWLAQAEQLSQQGYRVLALACRVMPSSPEPPVDDEVETGLSLLGLAALLDPPREEAHAAVQSCLEAGITPVMITGDHPGTASAIAQRIGLATAEDAVVTGRDLEALDDSQLAAKIRDLHIFARVSPEQKIRIVDALQAQGEFVAMTGDGVNDAPALKGADIGVAMGQKGTDVAREAADMVLLDDNFATIVTAIREGRRIFDNIRKFVKYTMTSNAGEIWVLALAPFLGLPIPLLPIHILWINLITDGLPGLALTAQPAEPGLMQRPPRPPAESLFANGLWQHIFLLGLLIAALSLFSQYWALRNDWHWQTIIFTVLTFCQLAHVLVIRDDRDSLFRLGLFYNRPLLFALLLSVLLQLLIIYLPVFNDIFSTEALTLGELAFCFALPSLVIAAVEGSKWLHRRGGLHLNPEGIRLVSDK